MEKLSRVKKYEELRKSIEVDNNINSSIQTSPHVEQEEALKKFDSSVFKKVEVQGDASYTPEREKSLVHNDDRNPLSEDTFTNEYLDDFIKEVRDYNIKKGNREIENTQADILYQLNSANRTKRTHYSKEMQADLVNDENAKKMVVSKDAIALEVANLLQEDMESDVTPSDENTQLEETTIDQEHTGSTTMELHLSSQPDLEVSVAEEANKLEEGKAQEKVEEPIQTAVVKQRELPQKKQKKIIYPIVDNELEESEIPIKSSSKDAQLQAKLLEETQQLRVQMDEYEDDLTDLSVGVEKTNKLLNFLLCFLILALLIVIGVLIYSLYNNGGI